MKRLVTVLVVVLALSGVAALAQNITPNRPGVPLHTVYLKSSIWATEVERRPTPMPMPIETEPSSNSNHSSASVFSGGGLQQDSLGNGGLTTSTSLRSGSLLAVAGGRFMSPKMQADRQIRKVIKRLD